MMLVLRDPFINFTLSPRPLCSPLRCTVIKFRCLLKKSLFAGCLGDLVKKFADVHLCCCFMASGASAVPRVCCLFVGPVLRHWERYVSPVTISSSSFFTLCPASVLVRRHILLSSFIF